MAFLLTFQSTVPRGTKSEQNFYEPSKSGPPWVRGEIWTPNKPMVTGRDPLNITIRSDRDRRLHNHNLGADRRANQIFRDPHNITLF